MSEANESQVAGQKTVPLDRYNFQDVLMTFSDDMAVSFRNGVFILYFFQSQPPIVMTQEEIAEVEAVKSRCVAKIVVTPNQMRNVIDAMVGNFGKFEKLVEENLKQHEDNDNA